MLNHENTVFVLVDVQGKLSKIVHDSERVIGNLSTLIQGLDILHIPILWLEQYPEGLGKTNEALSTYLTGAGLEAIHKITFNAAKNQTFMDALETTKRSQILIAGIETHICVYQTAAGLKSWGYEVEVVADAVSSRTNCNKEIGLQKMRELGILTSSVEMALYELMETADGQHFKDILPLLK
ncbi:isochorismatase family protein [Virgibacillus sp. NKC19-3]|uniref:isochorismatase family protein n=1 Tax=Virgibacillus saliphilus TaxID=2831674 RepID=UPI001C9A616A|nr:isochorismatase family protein [Virgibacillus sp. NKC19-3]MBY7142434.1 isochorismatase family protein [Virgibacillus sp. NKC19-3]